MALATAGAVQIAKLSMEETDRLDDEDERGFLALTYSGSLLTVGPLNDGKRSAEYTSIGLRQDVPDSAESEDARLDGPVEVDGVVSFAEGPVKNTSPVYKVAVFSESIDAEEQEHQLSMATQVLTEEFVDVNKTLMLD